jgi:hypothetical protein
MLFCFAGLPEVECYTPRLLISQLHSKTASKAGTSMWIPAVRIKKMQKPLFKAGGSFK